MRTAGNNVKKIAKGKRRGVAWQRHGRVLELEPSPLKTSSRGNRANKGSKREKGGGACKS